MCASTYRQTPESVVLYTYEKNTGSMSGILESKTAIARPDSKSLRATVPEGIVAFLGLQSGDILDWKMEFKNGERLVEVRKASKKAK
jgi:hypothetical protein